MNLDKKITVIVPAYNLAPWLPRCLDSVINQTYNNIEIIVINDGSTDNTREIIDQYAKRDKRVMAVHQENTGLISVRERGISMAKGEYIGFVDGDDEIELDMYERLLKNALKYDADISQCGILYCFYDGRRNPMYGTDVLKVFNKYDGYRELLRGKIMEPSLCNKLYKAELLNNSCLDLSITNNEDLLRNAVLFSRAQKSVYEDFCGYHYWRRKDSMSNNDNAVRNGTNILKARSLILDHAEECLRDVALSAYISGLVIVYNSLIGKKERESIDLRKKCRYELKHLKNNIAVTEVKIKKRAKAIIGVPIMYNCVHWFYMKRVYAKIKRHIK